MSREQARRNVIPGNDTKIDLYMKNYKIDDMPFTERLQRKRCQTWALTLRQIPSW